MKFKTNHVGFFGLYCQKDNLHLNGKLVINSLRNKSKDTK